MKKQKFNIYNEISRRSNAKHEEWELFGLFHYMIDGGISDYNSDVHNDFSNLSNNLYFCIQEEPSGMENLNFRIAIYDYNTHKTIDAWHLYFKTYTGKHTPESWQALKEIRQILDDMQEDIYNGTLKLN